MPLYEHVFLARQDASSQQIEAITKEFADLLSENGGKVTKTEYWGLKNLAYKIKKNRKAHFSLMNIDAPSAAVSEMERRMSIQPDIIRFITLRVDEHETEPSAMMRKQDREENLDRLERPSKFGGAPFADKGFDRERGSTFRQRPPREGGSFRESEPATSGRPPRVNRNEPTSTEET